MSKLVSVNEPFRYSPDGFTIISVPAGEQELDEDAVGLGTALGVISDASQKQHEQPRRRARAAVKAE
ncbi:hypothetical protein [Kerstersia gyiorum]|uniref:hypothetical protein n=1 Tax=Kerstersia gyiorum TaxID=206506 RepID=UPI00128FE938|nr:hypothetical protein [Kerstersia gyiorum]